MIKVQPLSERQSPKIPQVWYPLGFLGNRPVFWDAMPVTLGLYLLLLCMQHSSSPPMSDLSPLSN